MKGKTEPEVDDIRLYLYRFKPCRPTSGCNCLSVPRKALRELVATSDLHNPILRNFLIR